MTRARHRLFDAKRRDGLTTRMEDNQMRREYRGFITIPGMRPIPAYWLGMTLTAAVVTDYIENTTIRGTAE